MPGPEDIAPELAQANPAEAAMMNIEPADAPELPSPPHLQTVQDTPMEGAAEDVTVTGTGYTVPGASTVLAKHQEESPSTQKNKAKLDLEDYSSFSASELHAGYLNRLHASRDMEAGLVNMMKQKYEVRSPSCLMHI